MLLVLLVPIMMTQDEWDDDENNNGDDDNAKMMEGMLEKMTKVNIHWSNSSVKLISHTACKMKTMNLKELV